MASCAAGELLQGICKSEASCSPGMSQKPAWEESSPGERGGLVLSHLTGRTGLEPPRWHHELGTSRAVGAKRDGPAEESPFGGCCSITPG